jgi:hypothetical protein
MSGTTRKKPFSSKKKKEQLKLKREKIRAEGNVSLFREMMLIVVVFLYLGDKWADSDDESALIDVNNPNNSRRRINEQPVREGTTHNPNR